MLKYSSCADWHGTSYSYWLIGNVYGFYRGGNGGIFSFDGAYPVWKNDDYCGRGVAVIGTGL